MAQGDKITMICLTRLALSANIILLIEYFLLSSSREVEGLAL
jgi:hypothetical protein